MFILEDTVCSVRGQERQAYSGYSINIRIDLPSCVCDSVCAVCICVHMFCFLCCCWAVHYCNVYFCLCSITVLCVFVGQWHFILFIINCIFIVAYSLLYIYYQFLIYSWALAVVALPNVWAQNKFIDHCMTGLNSVFLLLYCMFVFSYCTVCIGACYFV